MSAMEPLCHLIGINSKKFSKKENSLLEGELFIRICNDLKEIFRQQYQSFFCFMKFTATKEDEMLEKNFIRLILKDILLTE